MKSWRTTLAGIIAGFPIAADAIIDAAKAGAFDHKSGSQLVIGIALVVIGALSKDHNVTGK